MKGKKGKEKESSQGVTRWAVAIALIAFGLILLLAAFGHVGLGTTGIASDGLFTLSYDIFGIAAYVLPFIVICIGVMVILKRNLVPPLVGTGSAFILISLLALLGIMSQTLGGMTGSFVGHLASDLFGVGGAVILLIALALLGLIIATDIVVQAHGSNEQS
jgi:S-DNA-T family DNA segregation ATPase FtsK/SpoIIIE